MNNHENAKGNGQQDTTQKTKNPIKKERVYSSDLERQSSWPSNINFVRKNVLFSTFLASSNPVSSKS